MRISRDEMFMRMAFVIAERATCPRAHVGALLVNMGRPISMGYNGSMPGEKHCHDVGCLIGPDGGCRRTTHAEANAVAWAARHGVPTDGSTLYCTHAPCRACGMSLVQAGIERVVYSVDYREAFAFPIEIRYDQVHPHGVGTQVP